MINQQENTPAIHSNPIHTLLSYLNQPGTSLFSQMSSALEFIFKFQNFHHKFQVLMVNTTES